MRSFDIISYAILRVILVVVICVVLVAMSQQVAQMSIWAARVADVARAEAAAMVPESSGF